jgi:hypothetical protein
MRSESPRAGLLITRITTVVLATIVMTMSGRAQEPAAVVRAAGAGWLAPGVFATWEGHRSADSQTNDPETPLTLDLLVLWRGSPGWFDYEKVAAGAGAPRGTHSVTSRGRTVRLTFDRERGTVRLQRDTLDLQGANVLLLDDVDNPAGALVAGTRIVDPAALMLPTQTTVSADPVRTLLRQAPELVDYLRCDPIFADPNDPGTLVTLGTCTQLR